MKNIKNFENWAIQESVINLANRYINYLCDNGHITSDALEKTTKEEDLDNIRGSYIEVKKNVLDILLDNGSISKELYSKLYKAI